MQESKHQLFIFILEYFWYQTEAVDDFYLKWSVRVVPKKLSAGMKLSPKVVFNDKHYALGTAGIEVKCTVYGTPHAKIVLRRR